MRETKCPGLPRSEKFPRTPGFECKNGDSPRYIETVGLPCVYVFMCIHTYACTYVRVYVVMHKFVSVAPLSIKKKMGKLDLLSNTNVYTPL